MISFRAITEDNFSDIIAMKRPENERFVASNAVTRHVYDKLGFAPTGDVNHGDEDLRRVLTDGDKA